MFSYWYARKEGICINMINRIIICIYQSFNIRWTGYALCFLGIKWQPWLLWLLSLNLSFCFITLQKGFYSLYSHCLHGLYWIEKPSMGPGYIKINLDFLPLAAASRMEGILWSSTQLSNRTLRHIDSVVRHYYPYSTYQAPSLTHIPHL